MGVTHFECILWVISSILLISDAFSPDFVYFAHFSRIFQVTLSILCILVHFYVIFSILFIIFAFSTRFRIFYSIFQVFVVILSVLHSFPRTFHKFSAKIPIVPNFQDFSFIFPSKSRWQHCFPIRKSMQITQKMVIFLRFHLKVDKSQQIHIEQYNTSDFMGTRAVYLLLLSLLRWELRCNFLFSSLDYHTCIVHTTHNALSHYARCKSNRIPKRTVRWMSVVYLIARESRNQPISHGLWQL